MSSELKCDDFDFTGTYSVRYVIRGDYGVFSAKRIMALTIEDCAKHLLALNEVHGGNLISFQIESNEQ